MADATNSGIASGSAASGALGRAANAAHSALDRAIGTAAPAAEWIDQTARSQQQRYEATADYLRESPIKSVAIAFVAGLIIGKILL
jgi:ElaB/YqjD/DUF883 family membrane-anchored ribosome-binding protein